MTNIPSLQKPRLLGPTLLCWECSDMLQHEKTVDHEPSILLHREPLILRATETDRDRWHVLLGAFFLAYKSF